MSDDFHVHGPHDHELEHVSHHNNSHSFANQIAVTTAILATIGAIYSYMGGATQANAMLYKNNAAIAKTEASDQWNYYQAKNNRQNLNLLALDLLPENKRGSYEKMAGRYEQEKEEIKNDFSKQLEKTAANNEKKVELFKQIASHSQEEGLVVFDDKNQLFFSNNLARANIKDFNVVLNAVLENHNRLIMEDCEANVVTKTYENYKIVSLRRTSVHDNKNGGLLDRHNKNMTNSLNNTQKTYLSLLDELQEMSKESKETATGSTQGLNLINEIVSDTNNLHKEIEVENEVVNSLVSKSKDIAQVINIIQEIAFQTNILSLNAAVEAATAGEAGRGFAVVAAEVRNLASRSAEAAKEIKTLVENATNKANNGKNIADKMISGYGGLTDNITKTMQLIKGVEVAIKEQQQGIEQINNAINSLDQQTQANAIVASQTKDIANQTQSIALTIVADADEKEFEGKHTVKTKKHDVSASQNQTIIVKSKPKKIESNVSAKVEPKKEVKKDITANTKENDEWESF